MRSMACLDYSKSRRYRLALCEDCTRPRTAEYLLLLVLVYLKYFLVGAFYQEEQYRQAQTLCIL